MFRKLLLALALTASPAMAEVIDPGHKQLLETTQQHITVTLNPLECWEEDNVYGYYWAARELIVVCQEGADRVGVEVAWTDQDYDTLRHEVHHLIQDCVVGGIGDGKVDRFIEDKDRAQFLDLALTPEIISQIRDAYADKDETDINLEIEAFAVARTIDPVTIARTVDRMCTE